MSNTPENQPDASQTTAAQDYHDVYSARLAAAVRVLTEAARMPRPQLRRTDVGTWVEDPNLPPERSDFAEFVTLALAGVAANLGGIEDTLAGRPGSWEAEGVRQLLASTVGADQDDLWRHRTEPVRIVLNMESLAIDTAPEVVEAYQAAGDQLDSRYETVAAETEIDQTRYCWVYEGTLEGELTAADPAAPAWSWEAWRSYAAQGVDSQTAATWEDSLRYDLRHGYEVRVFVPKTPEDAAEFDRLEEARDAQLQAIADLGEQLEDQRTAEYTAYGELLKARIEARAAAIGLEVPVIVEIRPNDFDRATGPGESFAGWSSLERHLVEHALMDVPQLTELSGTPLERLTANLAAFEQHTTNPDNDDDSGNDA